MKIDGQAAPLVFSAASTSPGPGAEANRDRSGIMDAPAPDWAQKPNLDDVQRAMDFSNEFMKLANHHLEFLFQEASQKLQVKVVNSDTGDIIREIPPDYMMKIAEQLQSKIQAEAGLLIDKIA
jgi:flagellar protein FlaG